ncbi:MAG: DUF692 domain-containing protein [Alphaproteobacteria bacterium]
MPRDVVSPDLQTSIPLAAGIGLRHPHAAEIRATSPDIAWLEVHSENYIGIGGPRLAELLEIRRDYPITCHGVGLSLGTSTPPDPNHLSALVDLFDKVQPVAVSEHVAWARAGDGTYLNDLLPLPYTEEALSILCRNVQIAQDAFKRPILMENPSSYLEFASSRIPEPDFMAELARRTGCGILLDVNNIHVSAVNHGLDPVAYLQAMPANNVGEIHVAGHSEREIEGRTVLVDTHSTRPIPEVRRLLEQALEIIGPTPVLIEWDLDIPALDVLIEERDIAQAALDTVLAHTPSGAR